MSNLPNTNSISPNRNTNAIRTTTTSPTLRAVAKFILNPYPLVTIGELSDLFLNISQTSYAILVALSAEQRLYHSNMILWNGLHRK